ncbi:MAG: NEW3 domain-containing protein [Pseudomonadota bacterium]
MVFKRAFLIGIFLMVSTLITFHIPDAAFGKEYKGSEQRPDRLVAMAVEYPSIQVTRGERIGQKININVFFRNFGKTDENLDVKLINKYKEWKATLTTFNFYVTGVYIPSGKDKSVIFEAEADRDIKPGKYQFPIKAQTPDGKFKLSKVIEIEVLKEKSELDKSRGIKLTSSYPEIQGTSDSTFKFTIDIDSTLIDDTPLELSAQGPDGWITNFKPSYEDKYISSLRIKVNERRTLNVEVRPSSNAKAGRYPINVIINTPKAKLETPLTVILTGTYSLDVRTAGGLLSLDAKQGKPSNISFYIKNTGSAENGNIKFMTFKPENWKVEFKPEIIDVIEPGDMKQVEMSITPYEDALVGDYSVGVDVVGEKVTKNIELRTTVKASAAWGWIGIGIIVLVIAGLFVLFRRFGRR